PEARVTPPVDLFPPPGPVESGLVLARAAGSVAPIGLGRDRAGRDWWGELELRHQHHLDIVHSVVWLEDERHAAAGIGDPFGVPHRDPRPVRQHKLERPEW